MNPARSGHTTQCLPIFLPTANTVSTVSSAVRTVRTTSTSFITCAGLKKCMPTTCSGRVVAAASAITGSDEVVEAMIAWLGIPGIILVGGVLFVLILK